MCFQIEMNFSVLFYSNLYNYILPCHFFRPIQFAVFFILVRPT